jgi:ribonuclease P protein component
MTIFKELFAFSKREVDFAFQNAKLSSAILGLKLLEAPLFCPDKNVGKILIVIPRRVGKAPERNKIRRRIKAIFYEKQLFKKHVSSILLVYPQAKQLSFERLSTFLCKALGS